MTKSTLWLIISLLRPTFYGVAPIISRLSDAIAAVLSGTLLTARISKNNILVICFLMFFSLIQQLSLLNSLFNYEITLSDFVQLSYPYIALLAFILGAGVKDGSEVARHIVIILTAGAILAIIQEIAGSTGKLIAMLHNTPALYERGRYGGFSYTHTEHAAFCALLIIFVADRVKTLWSRLILMTTAVISAFVPLSKAGLILVLITLITVVNWKILFLIFTVSLAIFINYYEIIYTYLKYVINGFIALAKMNISDGSVGPRYNDWVVTIQSLSDGAANMLVGGGPRRSLEDSYIEITAANILYRYGLLGFLSYYATLFYAAIQSFTAGKIHWVIFFTTLLFVDFMANFTESVKLFPFLYFLIGARCHR